MLILVALVAGAAIGVLAMSLCAIASGEGWPDSPEEFKRDGHDAFPPLTDSAMQELGK